jgi:hypothetical protein
MELFYAHSSSVWIAVTYYNGHFAVIDDSYDYKNFEDAILFEGTYLECYAYAKSWQANTRAFVNNQN